MKGEFFYKINLLISQDECKNISLVIRSAKKELDICMYENSVKQKRIYISN